MKVCAHSKKELDHVALGPCWATCGSWRDGRQRDRRRDVVRSAELLLHPILLPHFGGHKELQGASLAVDDPFDSVSPKHRWGPFRFTAKQVQSKLRHYLRGRFKRIKVLQRVTNLQLATANTQLGGANTQLGNANTQLAGVNAKLAQVPYDANGNLRTAAQGVTQVTGAVTSTPAFEYVTGPRVFGSDRIAGLRVELS